MALQVWMPLIKQELTQQGLSSGTLSGTPKWGRGGKISERCFRCDGPITTTIDGLKNVTTFSIAYWLYVDSSISTFTNYADFFELQATSGNTTTVIRDELRVNTANLGRHAFHMIKDASVGSNTYTYYSLGERDDAKDKWCHVVVTKDANYCDAYANGIRYAHVACSNFESSPCKLTGVMQLGMTGCTSGYLQDFRVYDHVLSQMEIKELSKGLVLHYPLNRGGWGQENLAKNSLIERTNSDYNIANFTTSQELTSGVKYTATIKGTIGADKKFGMWMGGGYTQVGFFTYQGNDIYTLTFTSPSTINGNGSRTAINIYAYPISNKNQSTLEWLKLEKGEKRTPWCPNSSDNLAAEMGLNGTIEYDCSGYCNNGTRTGTFSWTSNTPKYAVSTTINSSKIQCITNPITGDDPIFSIGFWFKLKSNISYIAYADLVSFSSSSYSNQPFRLEICGNPVGNDIYWFRGPSGNTGGFKINTNNLIRDTWYHTVLVSEGNKQYSYYINGIKTGTYNGSANSWIPTNIFNIGDGQAGAFDISDVRIYATALSADDVKSLYQNSAYIDSSGNVYGAVHSEV